MIKVVHTINAFTATSGGTSTCTYDLLCALNSRNDMQAQILVTQPAQPLMGHGESWIRALANDEKTAFGISANLREALMQTEADIYHTNGLWRYCNHVSATVARKKDKPFVLTPHGMLYPQAMLHSQWQKQLLRCLLFDRDLREAACIHVTCEEEMQHVRDLGYKTPVAVIGNPVPTAVVQPVSRRGKRIFGYLGRLHPRKHVERLIEAMACLSKEEQTQCELVIIGSGEPAYEAFLRDRTKQLLLKNVRFVGFVEGVQKQHLLASFAALFVPSDFENFGMIVAEALSCSTPVWASTGTPWSLLNEQGCGWWQASTIENIETAMRTLLWMPTKELDQMGAIGRRLVVERFAAEVVAQQMAELYQWIVTKQAKPSFVYD